MNSKLMIILLQILLQTFKILKMFLKSTVWTLF